MTTQPEPTLRAAGLTVRAGERTLVHELSAELQAGETWALLGANGAGKSTLLMALAGLRAVQGGTLLLNGQPVSAISPVKQARLRAYMPQQANDAFGMPVRQFVAQARAPFDSPWQFNAGGDSAELVDDALRVADVTHLAARNITQLSGGERQRVAIAAVLAQDTGLLLLDEPTAHLDPAHQMLVMRHFNGLTKLSQSPQPTPPTQPKRRLLVMALHDVNLALRFCTHAVLLQEHQTIAGPVSQVITRQNLHRLYGAPVQMISVAADEKRFVQVVWT